MLTRHLAAVLTLALALAGAAAAQFDPVLEARAFAKVDGKTIKMVVEIAIPEDAHGHLFHTEGVPAAMGKALVLKPKGAGVTWKLLLPEPVDYTGEVWDGGAGAMVEATGKVHYGTIHIYALGTFEGEAPKDIGIAIEGQWCTEGDGSQCYDVKEDLTAALTGGEAQLAKFPAAAAFDPPAAGSGAGSEAAAGSGAGSETATTAGADDAEEDPMSLANLGGFILLAFFAGLFALVMPCTYPMIPITISFFTKQAKDRDGSVLPLSLMYGLGIIVMFILIGVIVGEPIARFATHPATNLVIGVLFVVFALSLFGCYDLRPPNFLLNASVNASMKGGYVGVFLMGATLVITSFTCTAPFVGSLLAVGAEGGTMQVVIGMGVFGLTMAVPFVLLSLLPTSMSAMPKSGQWMNTVKVFLGFVELAAALKFFSNAEIVYEMGILTYELFLMLWAGLFGAAAAYLFGWINLKGSASEGVGPVQMTVGVLTLMFAIYCWYGAAGHRLDKIMLAIAPPDPYPGTTVSSDAGGAKGKKAARTDAHVIVKEDFDKAVALAKSSGKKVLINFTGVT